MIDLLPEQRAIEERGGTMRLGADPVHLVEGTRTRAAYGDQAVIYERHRHRYEVNPAMREQMEAAGLVISGRSPERAPGRGHRAARPPLVLRLPVPPRVQEPAHPAAAALPRLHRRRGERAHRRGRTAPEREPARLGG